MENLTQFEQNFLSLPLVSEGLQLNAIARLQKNLQDGKKARFTKTLQLATLVATATTFFKERYAQDTLVGEGVQWTTEDFAKKVFGWQKSYYYKVLKASTIPTEVVEEFNAECDRLETTEEKPLRTLESLLKYANAVAEATTTEGDESEGEGEGDESPSVETKVKTILTLAWKPEGGTNVAVRIDANGGVHTTNDLDAIAEAIEQLQQYLSNYQQVLCENADSYNDEDN